MSLKALTMLGYLENERRQSMSGREPRRGPLPQPSRFVLNAGILVGAAVGLLVSQARNADNLNAFVITAFCCLVGAAVFSYAEVLWRMWRARQER